MERSNADLRKINPRYLVPLVLFVFLSFAFFFCFAQTKWVMMRAKSYLEKDFRYMAAEYVDGYRDSLSSDAEGCKILIDAYSRTQKVDKLAWTVEACSRNDFDGPELRLSVAQLQTVRGDDESAMRTLTKAMSQFDHPGLWSAQMLVLRKLGLKGEVVKTAKSAFYKFPANPEMNVMVMNAFAEAALWKEAREAAERIRALRGKVEIAADLSKRMIEVYEKAGDREGAQDLTNISPQQIAASAQHSLVPLKVVSPKNEPRLLDRPESPKPSAQDSAERGSSKQ